MRLFHFSNNPGIELFVPRPVQVPSQRRPGQEWLNGPLVWAIDDWHQPLYLFPRDCPRVLVWPGPETNDADRTGWWAGRTCRMLAHIEEAWWPHLKRGRLFRYELPSGQFEDLGDAGMFVARDAVAPQAIEALTDLPAALEQQDVELRLMRSLAPLAGVWSTSLHASGIRLRNARGWPSMPAAG